MGFDLRACPGPEKLDRVGRLTNVRVYRQSATASYLVKASNPVANTRAAQSMRAVFAAGSRGGDRVVKVTDLSPYKRICSERPVLERGREFDSRPPHILLRPTEAASAGQGSQARPCWHLHGRALSLCMWSGQATRRQSPPSARCCAQAEGRSGASPQAVCPLAPPPHRPRDQGLRTPPLVLLTTPHLTVRPPCRPSSLLASTPTSRRSR